MRSSFALALVPVLAMAVGGCSGSSAAPSTAPTTAPSAAAVASLTPSVAPVATPAASSSAVPSPSDIAAGSPGTPPAVDPCTLLTQDEASGAVGAKLGAGVGTQVDQDRVCTWKTGTTEVKVILAPPAPDAATAQAYWDGQRGQVPPEVKIHDVAGFDRAAYGSGGVSGYSVSALFVIHGTTFFDFYCGLKACTEANSVTAANAIVGRLP